MAPPKSETQLRVSVVDDKVVFRRGIRAILELTSGIACTGFYASAEEALLKTPNATPDVVLMDLNLPGQSGIDCTRILRERFPTILL